MVQDQNFQASGAVSYCFYYMLVFKTIFAPPLPTSADIILCGFCNKVQIKRITLGKANKVFCLTRIDITEIPVKIQWCGHVAVFFKPTVNLRQLFSGLTGKSQAKCPSHIRQNTCNDSFSVEVSFFANYLLMPLA